MNKKRHNQNILIQKLQTIKLVRNPLRNVKPIVVVFLIPLMFVGIIILPPALSSLVNSVTIRSSGQIAVTLPLHVDGRYIKNLLNSTVYLRGVWGGSFVDVSTGWWGLDASKWDETALRYTLQTLQQQWGANCINTFIWGDWWLGNKNASLMGGDNQTNIGCRDAIIRTVEVAAEYGIYIQLRLYGCNRTEGRVEGLPFAPDYAWSVQNFTDFWVNITTTLKDYPNVIYHLFDEPVGNQTTWFSVANQTITAIRAAGVNQLIAIHWGYCGDMMWVGTWVNAGYPTTNILFSEHIYRSLGSFQWNSNYPVDINSIRSCLNSTQGEPYGTATKYIQDTYDVPVWVSAVGGLWGTTDDNEYIAFRNTLQVLNEWNISYIAYTTGRTQPQGALTVSPATEVFGAPNRMGQALIDAIAGITPPSIYQLNINSNIALVPFNMSGNAYSTPFAGTRFADNYTVYMPSSITVCTHNSLFGGTTIGSGSSYSIYLYTAGPYTINSSATVSAINLYTVAAGNASVAIYDSTTYPFDRYPSDWPHPNNLIVKSAEQKCQANTWNTFSFTTTQLNSGTYFLAIKINTNGMLAGSGKLRFGQFISSNYADPFPNRFGTIAGGTGVEYAVYIQLAQIQTSSYNFTYWEDNSTNPERTVNLTTNMNLTATYQPAT